MPILRRVRSFLTCVPILAVGGIFSACSGAVAAEPSAAAEPASPTVSPGVDTSGYWPTDGWRTSTPEEQGMDGGLIGQALEAVERDGISLHSLLVIRHGYIVSESYFQGYTETRKHELYSVTKSFVSTLTGIAIDQGYIDGIQTPVTDFFPGTAFENPDPRKNAMTLEDVLTMRTGLDWLESDSTFFAMHRAPDWGKFVLDLPLADDPGGEFLYCSGCSHLLSTVVQKASGMPLRDFADRYLFSPLGITAVNWETGMDDVPIGGWGLSLTPRDMAKLGYLFLHGGNWDGRRIVSAEWVTEATRTQAEAGAMLDYGYQWWVYSAHHAYLALGRYGQTIYVLPDLDMIIVTTAAEEGHDHVFELADLYLILAAENG